MNITEKERLKYENVWKQPSYRVADHSGEVWEEYCQHITKDKWIVDFGCGAGKLVNKLNNEGYRAYGIDIASNSVNPEIYEKWQYKFLFCPLWDLTTISPLWNLGTIEIEPFDVGICADVMEHIPEMLVKKTFFSMFKVCKEVYFLIEGVLDYAGRMGKEPLHLTVRPKEWWIEVAKNFGTVTILPNPKKYPRSTAYFLNVKEEKWK